MQKLIKYAIFPTEWGHFGLAGTQRGLLRTYLPTPKYEQAQARLLHFAPLAQFDGSFFKEAQNSIIAYFRGSTPNLSQGIPVDLAGLTAFQRKVLTACRRIPPGKTTTYGELAVKIGKPKAARAVGNALAKNPLPLIIPCHRVLAANNHLGGFSAPGGTELKQKMLRHEENYRG
ncbi:MAG: methylated-DNA--[protein]-cysteine S-methyltransferase [Planctomycetota bacterium]|jgi:methylated-DNA-[protein]-cysteine S-methyltransferase